MVRADEVDDLRRQRALLPEDDPIGDVADDHAGTLVRREQTVGAIGRGILSEELRVQHLAYIVVERPSTDQLRIGPDTRGGGLR